MVGGIAGHTTSVPSSIEAMEAVLQHRGTRSFYHSSTEGFTLVGLSPFDPTISPFSSAASRAESDSALGIAGEVRDAQGKTWQAEELLEQLMQHGIEVLFPLRGAFTLYFQQGQDLWIFRDPVGRRTIFYAYQNGHFYFATEVKGIWAHPQFEAKLHRQAIATYFTFSFLPLGETMLEDVYEVPAGSYVHYRKGGSPTVHRYFECEAIPKAEEASENYWCERIRNEVDAEISRAMARTQSVGVFLSGGLDSSLITARVQHLLPHRVPTFSIHFGKKYQNELAFAAMVAEQHQTEHHEVLIRPKHFLPSLRETIWYLDDPVGDPITVPNFELAKYARQYCKLIFNGEGGDPCFGGPKNIPMMLGHWYAGGTSNVRERANAYLASYRRGFTTLNELLLPNIWNGAEGTKRLEEILIPFLEDKRPANFLDKLMIINMRLKGAHLILPKVERMLGAHQLTPISPLFTREIVESSLAMPSTLKLQKGIEKYILKRAFASDLPPAVVERPKSGMRVPVQYWFQGEMKRYAKHLLHSKKIEEIGLFNSDVVRRLLRYDSESGLKRHGLLLWMLTTFEIWRRIFIEKERV